MNFDNMDWSLYEKDDKRKILKDPYFYFSLVFAGLFLVLLASCASPSTAPSAKPVRTFEPGYLRR